MQPPCLRRVASPAPRPPLTTLPASSCPQRLPAVVSSRSPDVFTPRVATRCVLIVRSCRLEVAVRGPGRPPSVSRSPTISSYEHCVGSVPSPPQKAGFNHSRAAAVCLLGGLGLVSPAVGPSPVSRLTYHPRLAPRLASPQPHRTVPPHWRVLGCLSNLLSLSETRRITSSLVPPDVVQLMPCPSLVTRRTCRTGYVFPGPSSTLRTAQLSHRNAMPGWSPPSRASDRPFTHPARLPGGFKCHLPMVRRGKPGRHRSMHASHRVEVLVRPLVSPARCCRDSPRCRCVSRDAFLVDSPSPHGLRFN